MGQRCTVGEHGPCSGCEGFIPPTQLDHAHIFRGGGRKNDIICSACWLCIAVASQRLLTAVHDAGFVAVNPRSLREFLDEYVIIGIQQPLDFTRPSEN